MMFLPMLAVLLGMEAAAATSPTELFLRGHAIVPTPQKVSLKQGNILLDESWTVDAQPNIATRSLLEGLNEFHALALKSGAAAARKSIVLRVSPGAVSEGSEETRAQAYRLRIAPGRIEIIGNGDAGLFYGVQTLIQLVKRGPRGSLVLPECEIDDWPRLALRFMHWDTKHHQDRIATIKRNLDWAARFKVNMIGFELEDKFAYPSNPVIGAPGAFTPQQLQEIVNYGLERFIQVVPVVQAPAHMGYVLKHPQFAHLRADGNNYQSCLCLEDTYRLIFQMFDDLIAATRGVDYFFVSTDEIYYAGIGNNCKEPYTPESRSARWAEFARRAHDHLAGKGRRMLAWLEYPLLAKDLEQIPGGVIDGVVGDESYTPIERRKGMRQLAYVSMQGAELLFPDHLAIESLPADSRLGEFESVFTSGHLNEVFSSIPGGRAMELNPIGVFGAAWDDSGLHNETFWLGWVAATRWGWRPGVPNVEQHTAEFMQVYYGEGSGGMVEVYRSLQRQARAWQRSWDRVVSRVRGPGYGNSFGKGVGTERQDLSLTPPPLPSPGDLAFQPAFAARYREWVADAPSNSLQNDQLQAALAAHMLTVDRNRYNLEVFLALARFTGHHWRLLSGLAAAERSLERAAVDAKAGRPREAVGRLVEAYSRVAGVEDDRAAVWRNVQDVFEKSTYRKGRSVGGKQYVHVFDDTKDHWADRSAGLDYMVMPERSIGLAEWRAELDRIIRDYAARHNVPVGALAKPRLEE
ncbi:MAG TPA: beta-N-acetylhexosaminidase [Bryobacteraceae bacterium]|nr:beta-N-acetylhexosaminidase [Bryobacteraceae bacterium]